MTPTTIDEYHASFPENVRERLDQVRAVIKKAAPQAEESISYGLPTYKIGKKPVIYYGGFANHIGLYATPDGHAEFEVELSKYKRGKGSVQFPLDQPLPLDLIERITVYRVETVKNRRNYHG